MRFQQGPREQALEQSAHVFAKIIDDVNKVEMNALLGAPVTTR